MKCGRGFEEGLQGYCEEQDSSTAHEAEPSNGDVRTRLSRVMCPVMCPEVKSNDFLTC